MHIAILTQALHSNYGGILQNYALQEVLRQMGHTSVTLDRHLNQSSNLLKDFGKRLLQLIKPSYDQSLLTAKQKAIISSNQERFITQNIARTQKLFSQQAFDEYVQDNVFDAYIVGSDQCWRPMYSANIFNYFLDFLPNSSTAKRIAYAASFGVEKWEFSDVQSQQVPGLAKRFDAISVREESALALCKKYLGVSSSWVLDPTMLLGSSGFERFIQPISEKDYLLTYFLEASDEIQELCSSVQERYHLSSIVNNLNCNVFHRGQNLKSVKNISVEKWLSNIYHSSFVVTDSFHGAVFSLLFNKPFVVRLNKVRGNARLESLLTDFNLKDCIVTSKEIPAIDFDWERINRHLAERQTESMSFLRNALAV